MKPLTRQCILINLNKLIFSIPSPKFQSSTMSASSGAVHQQRCVSCGIWAEVRDPFRAGWKRIRALFWELGESLYCVYLVYHILTIHIVYTYTHTIYILDMVMYKLYIYIYLYNIYIQYIYTQYIYIYNIYIYNIYTIYIYIQYIYIYNIYIYIYTIYIYTIYIYNVYIYIYSNQSSVLKCVQAWI